MLNHWDDAIKDLEFLLDNVPSERDSLLIKIKEAKKERKKKLFKESIQVEEGQVSSSKNKNAIDAVLEKTSIETSYSGMVLPENGEIDQGWINSLVDNMKNNKFIHKKYLVLMLDKLKKFFETQKSLVDINIPE